MKGVAIDKNIAMKYAKAFMAVFPKTIVSNIMKNLEHAQIFLQRHKRTLFFLQLPQFDDERRKSMVADLIGYFALPEDLAHMVLLLIKHNRSYHLPDVLACIAELYKERMNYKEFSIESAHDMSTQQIESIKQFLESKLNKKIIGVPSIDTSLIAGLRLQSNDYLWEYSIRKQLKTLRSLKT